jgi:hypothetical protein
MLRTTVGVSFLVLFGVLSACSSKATDNDNGGGNGAVLGGSGGSGSGGSSSNSGGSAGTRANTAGTTAANGGTAATTGGTNGLCSGDALTCIDDTMATFCDPDTGVEETFSCIEDAASIGFVSSGCTMGTGLTEDTCAFDSVADAKCLKGAQGYAFCGGFTTNEQLLNIYINCFQDNNGGHTVVQCFADYVSPTMMADTDCMAAEQACLGLGAGGAGGADGAGGAR